MLGTRFQNAWMLWKRLGWMMIVERFVDYGWNPLIPKEILMGNQAMDQIAARNRLRLLIRLSEHTWAGFLEDSEESLTMAILGTNCLDFDHGGYGRRCS
ncbi:hypothetical protein ACEPPN_004323 [Leptodophora sp. 'Broadleaf-Isolate-01']